MVCISYWPTAIAFLFTVAVQSQAQPQNTDQVYKTPASKPLDDVIVAEEVIVKSDLAVRPKPSVPSKRLSREAPLLSSLISRIKRQIQSTQNSQANSQATAQSNSHSHNFGPCGAQTADALASAQAFQTSYFGATSNNAASINQAIDPCGNRQQGGAAFSGGQTYNLPNGQTLNIAYNNGYNTGSNSPPSTHQGSAISIG